MWCCHNPYPGCFANPSDAAAHCKVPRKSDGAKKQSPDMTKCGEYVYCCDEKCPEGTGDKPSGGDATPGPSAATKRFQKGVKKVIVMNRVVDAIKEYRTEGKLARPSSTRVPHGSALHTQPTCTPTH